MECSKGYFGETCDKPCPPGSFGFMCGGKCFSKCSKEDCNHVSGCPNDKMTTLQPLKKEPTPLTTYETSWRVTTSKRTAVPSSRHTLLITEVPNTQMGLIRVNILAGGSLLIVFLLFAIFRELYTCKRKKSKNTREQNDAFGLSVAVVREGKDLGSNEMSHKRNISNSIQCGEPQYFTIDNLLQVRHSRRSPGRQRTIRNKFTGLFNCISGMRRTKNFFEV